MKKVIVAILLFILPLGGSYAQHELDSLTTALSHKQTARDSIRLMGMIGNFYLDKASPESKSIALQYYTNAVKLAERINDKKALITSKNKIGIYYMSIHDPICEKIFLDNIEAAHLIKDTVHEASTLIQLGNLYVERDSTTAVKVLNKAIGIFTLLKDSSGIAQCWIRIGDFYTHRGDFQKSVNYHLDALKVLEKTSDKYSIGSLLFGLGVDNYVMGNYDAALDYHFKSLDVFKQIDARQWISSNLINIGNLYQVKKDYKKALLYDEEALDILQKNNDEESTAPCLITIGSVYKEMKDYKKAIQYLDKAVGLISHYSDNLHKCSAYDELADIYFQTKDFKKALSTYEKMMAIAKDKNLSFYLLEGYSKLSETYAQEGNYKNAYEQQSMYTALKDSMFNKEKSKQIAEMQLKYETEKKNKEILLLNKDKEVMRAKISKKNIGLIAVSAAGVLIILLIILLLSRRNLVTQNRYEKELNIQQQQIALTILKAQEEERQKIAKDMHDSLGAYLSSLRINMEVLQPTIIEDKKLVYYNILLALDKVTKEIRSIAKNLVSDTLQQYGLEIAVEELAEFINQSGKIKIIYNATGLKKRFAPELETGVFRIVQELLNNSLKHASAKVIKLDIVEKNEVVSIVFVDDGVGFDKEDMKNERKGIGLKSMEARAKILKGSFNFDSKPGSGSLFKIEIPYVWG